MSLKVLMPFKQPGNSFFEEIINNSATKFIYGSLESDITIFDFVLFHWPELIFNWGHPSDEDLNRLKDIMLKWKNHVKIIYVVHNERNHFSSSSQFKKLYDLIIDFCDVMVHFGEYSLKKFSLKYPEKIQQYIPHPLYKNEFKILDKNLARKELGIALNKTVILVPGRVRKIEERNLIVNAFKTLNIKDKMLLVPYMYKKTLPLKYPGSYRLQRINSIKRVLDYLLNKEKLSTYKFTYDAASKEKLSLMLSASDIVFIPRINSLNSGIFFLGLTYKKIIVGPAIGNIEEFLDLFKLPKFNPHDDESITQAINKAGEIEGIYNKEAIAHFEPRLLAEQWDNMLLKILK